MALLQEEIRRRRSGGAIHFSGPVHRYFRWRLPVRESRLPRPASTAQGQDGGGDDEEGARHEQSVGERPPDPPVDGTGDDGAGGQERTHLGGGGVGISTGEGELAGGGEDAYREEDAQEPPAGCL